jgi:hypothetical protein
MRFIILGLILLLLFFSTNIFELFSDIKLQKEMEYLHQIIKKEGKFLTTDNERVFPPDVDVSLIRSIQKYLQQQGYCEINESIWKTVEKKILGKFRPFSFSERNEKNTHPSTNGIGLLAKEVDIDYTTNYIQDLTNINVSLLEVDFKNKDMINKEIVKTYDPKFVDPLNTYTPYDISVNQNFGVYPQLENRQVRKMNFKCQRPWFICQNTNFLDSYRLQ